MAFAKRLEEEAIEELERAGSPATVEDIPDGALLKLMLSTALAPGRNALTSLKTLQLVTGMKAKDGTQSAAEFQAEMDRFFEGACGRRVRQ